jgi:hypothetical protein
VGSNSDKEDVGSHKLTMNPSLVLCRSAALYRGLARLGIATIGIWGKRLSEDAVPKAEPSVVVKLLCMAEISTVSTDRIEEKTIIGWTCSHAG